MSANENRTADPGTVFPAAGRPHAKTAEHTKTGYRPEIDGLRAVAVIPVILFHAGFSVFSGGYIGVDVFFVISGYLITGILLSDMDRGTFSVVKFYERRARRILPALFFVMAVSLLLAWSWMLPAQLENFAKSMISVATFSSNFFFWASEDYFAPAADQLALLHTWSLAVEEQYYVFFPPLLFLAWRLGRHRLFWITCGACALSLGFSYWASSRFPALNFYLLPSRAWELLAGSLCAIVMSRITVCQSSVLSGVGLVLVCLPIFLFEPSTPSVGLGVPVVGTAMIILFGGSGTLGALTLSLRPLVGVGLVSYSAYLWHQPLFAFARVRLPAEPSPYVMFLLSLAALGLAFLTWKFVEQPIRSRRSGFFASPSRIFVFSSAGTLGTILVGLALVTTQGAPSRVPEAVRRIDEARNDNNPLVKICHLALDIGMIGRVHPIEGCFTPSTQSGSRVILTGDSHANALSWELRKAVEKSGRSFYAVTMSSCPPISGLMRIDGPNRSACNDFVVGMRDYAERSAAEVVVLAARWRFSLDGSKFDNTEGGVERDDGSRLWERADGGTPPGLRGPELGAAMLAAYVSDIKQLLGRGVRVILVYPIPETGWNVPDRLARRKMASANTPDLSTSSRAFFERNKGVIDAFDAIEHPNLYRVKPSDILCDGFTPGRCVNSLGGKVLYYDENHLSNAGARMISPAIMDIIDKLP